MRKNNSGLRASIAYSAPSSSSQQRVRIAIKPKAPLNPPSQIVRCMSHPNKIPPVDRVMSTGKLSKKIYKLSLPKNRIPQVMAKFKQQERLASRESRSRRQSQEKQQIFRKIQQRHIQRQAQRVLLLKKNRSQSSLSHSQSQDNIKMMRRSHVKSCQKQLKIANKKKQETYQNHNYLKVFQAARNEHKSRENQYKKAFLLNKPVKTVELDFYTILQIKSKEVVKKNKQSEIKHIQPKQQIKQKTVSKQREITPAVNRIIQASKFQLSKKIVQSKQTARQVVVSRQSSQIQSIYNKNIQNSRRTGLGSQSRKQLQNSIQINLLQSNRKKGDEQISQPNVTPYKMLPETSIQKQQQQAQPNPEEKDQISVINDQLQPNLKNQQDKMQILKDPLKRNSQIQQRESEMHVLSGLLQTRRKNDETAEYVIPKGIS